MTSNHGGVDSPLIKENERDNSPQNIPDVEMRDNSMRSYTMSNSHSLAASRSRRGLFDVLGQSQLPMEEAQEYEVHESTVKRAPTLLGRILPPGSRFAGVVNLAAFTMGMGTLGMAMVMESCGALIGIILLLCTAVLCIFTATTLAICVDETASASMEEVGLKLYGFWMQRITSTFMSLLCLGIAVVYVIALGTIMEPLRGISGFPEVFQGKFGMYSMQAIMWAVTMLPLSMVKSAARLVIFCFVGVVGIVLVAIALMIHSSLSDRARRDNIVVVNFGFKTVLAFATCIFAFCYHPSSFGIYRELFDQRPKTLCQVCCMSSGVSSTIYILSGVFGLYLYGSGVKGNILLNLNEDDPLHTWYLFTAFVGFFCLIVLTFPLLLFPSRDSFLILFHYIVESDKDAGMPDLMGNSTITRNAHNLNRSTVLQRRSLAHNKNININIDYPLVNCPVHIRLVSGGGLALLCLILGLFVPNIDVMFGIIGSFCGGMVSFFLPAVFMLKLKRGSFTIREQGVSIFIGTYVALFFGIFAVLFGTGISTYSALYL